MDSRSDDGLRQQLASLEARLAAEQQVRHQAERDRDAGRLRERAITDVLERMHASPADPQAVLDAVVDWAHRLCGAEESALAQVDDHSFRFVAGHFPAVGGWDRTYPLSDGGITAEAIRTGRTQHVAGSLEEIARTF